MKKKSAFIFFISFFLQINCHCNFIFNADSSFNKKKIIWVGSSEFLLASSSLFALDRIWYAQYPKTRFHTFNDSKDWLQMDKVGHSVTSYYISYLNYELFRWSECSKNKSIWLGSTIGLAYLTTIEVMDGFYNEWGFSYYDMISNLMGIGLFSTQQYFWDEQRIKLKFSFAQSGLAGFRPSLLGSSIQEQILKDYNGQTYWVSINIHSFLKKESNFPKWMNIALGYGADGMIGGSNNDYSMCNGNTNCLNLKRTRQFYISLDADLTKIAWKNKFMRALTRTIGFIKVPFPALEINSNQSTFHWLYF